MKSGLPITPRIHPRATVNRDLEAEMLDSKPVRETIAGLGQKGDWEELWKIADSMSREVSVLFDAVGDVWVDIGTAGHVSLSPPHGAQIPFRLWVHTHPWDPYWSQTDKDTLACYSTILESALVLGHDRMKWSRNGPSPKSIKTTGPLSNWSSEPCEYYAQNPEKGGD